VTQKPPIKIAIVGGGCAAISAAFELTRPEHLGRYEVTVYQLGWRLGGKGASGRGSADRIEEHGLHLWMGFYENAFGMVRECYAELARDPARCPIATWQDAFEPAPLVGVSDRTPDGRWEIWKGILPPNEGLPGDGAAPRPWTIADYLGRSIALLRTLFETIQLNQPGEDAAQPARPAWPPGAPSSPAAVLDGMSRLAQLGELATLTGLIQAIGLFELAAGSLSQYPENVVLRLLDAIASNARSLLEARLQQDLLVRRIWQIVDLTLATVRGIVRFGLLTDPRGFDAIDEYDSREWLRLNGAAESSLGSGYIRALYDFGFSYEDGDPARPRISAGQALRSMLRAFFTYRGSFFWRMRAGMGDVVFAPFYEVLARRGVRFEFFHRLENVVLAARGRVAPGESPHVEALEFSVQAEIAGGRAYRPLVDVRGLPCWPARPDYAQLVDGARIEREGWDFESHFEGRIAHPRVVRVGDDFDLVVLGIGLGAVPYVCREILASDPRWRAMVDHVRTVATQAFQIWMRADMEDLGWPDAEITISGFVEPFDTWADMRHLLAQESWQGSARSLAYFCNVLPDAPGASPERDPHHGQRASEQVRANAVRFLDEEIRHLWPRAVDAAGGFPWQVLVDPAEASGMTPAAFGKARFESQFWKANVQPSDRYALSLPGSSGYRISPLDQTYDNLTIAGDWTDCGFNAGCVEAAVMSGRLAAHALSTSPPLEEIVGFDHP
jgi:uncharacterized protein with NAD-binding domain and iron-sulfur cluster